MERRNRKKKNLPCTLNNERIAAVSLGVKRDDIVAAFQGSNRMFAIEFLQPDFEFALGDVDAANVAYRLALISRFAFDALHVGVELGQTGEEVGPASDLLQRSRDQAMDGEGGGTGNVKAGDAGENHEFTRHVDAV